MAFCRSHDEYLTVNLGSLRLDTVSIETIVSQLSKCLKFMTFREGCLKHAVECKY